MNNPCHHKFIKNDIFKLCLQWQYSEIFLNCLDFSFIYICIYIYFVFSVRPDQPQILEAPIAPVILGEPTNITCEAKNGKPAAKISWYLNGQMMNRKLYSTEVRRKKNKLVDSIGHVLLVPKSEDSGKILECYAINEALTRPHKTSVKLDVQCECSQKHFLWFLNNKPMLVTCEHFH